MGAIASSNPDEYIDYLSNIAEKNSLSEKQIEEYL